MKAFQEGADRQSVLTLAVADVSTGGIWTVPLRYACEGPTVFVMAPRSPSTRWAETISSGSCVSWRIGSRTLNGSAKILASKGEVDSVASAFRTKFGAERFDRWFGSEFVCIALHPDGTRQDYYAHVRELFDRASAEYDRFVQGDEWDRLLRDISVGFLQRTFHGGDRVLEIGAGTGLETIPLAKSGVQIVATDISPGMLGELSKKAVASGVADQVSIRTLGASELWSILDEFGRGYFDGVFSDFGALNCEPQWRLLPSLLAALVRPGGRIVLGVWNRVSVMELVTYVLALNPRRALARLHNPVPVGLSRFGVPVYAHSPEEFERAFAPHFARDALLGLPVFLPPYDMARLMPAAEAFLPLLTSLDRRTRHLYPFNRLGDHFLLRMLRR